MAVTKQRIRRSKEDARRLIMEAAELLLRQNGPEAVNVRAVAAKVGITDAAINHHFGTRDELLTALLRHGGRRLKDELNAALFQWREADQSVDRLVEIMADLYADGGYAELALGLHQSGWRDPDSGMLEPVVEALHEARVREAPGEGRHPPSVLHTRFIVGLMHQTFALDPLFGGEFRRSAGVRPSDEPSGTQKKDMWISIFRSALNDPSD